MKKRTLLVLSILMVLFVFTGVIIGTKTIEKTHTKNLINAIEENDLVELSNLLEKNISKNEKPYFIGVDRRNYQALSVASDLGNFEAVKLLVENGASLNVVGSNGETPLLMAVKSYHKTKYEIIYYLIEKGADINKTNAAHRSAICELLYTSKTDDALERFELFQYLLEHGANIYDTSPYGCILFDACLNNDIQIVKYLFENYNLDTNMQSKKYKSTKVYNETLLMMTTYRSAIEVCEYLIENGIDKNIKSSNGKAALDIANEIGNSEIINLLTE